MLRAAAGSEARLRNLVDMFDYVDSDDTAAHSATLHELRQFSHDPDRRVAQAARWLPAHLAKPTRFSSDARN